MASRPKKPATVRLANGEKVASVAPSVRSFADWNPQRIRSADRMAESGNLSYAASVCDWLLTDDRVAGVLGARVNALLGLEPAFEDGSGRRAKAATKAMEVDEDWWEAYPESQVAQILTWGILLGVAPARHAWVEREDHGGRVLPMPAFWHPQTINYSWQTREWTVSDALGQRLVVTPGDSEWVLHTPYGSQRPWAYGVWRSLARWVLLKQYAMSDWARASEKGAVLVATAPDGSTQAQRKELAEDLKNCGEDTVVALANGFDLKMVTIAADTSDIYRAQIEMADLAIAIRIRGGNLSTNVEGGSHAAAESQAKTGDGAMLRFDATTITTTLHDQSLVWWAEFNFGDPKLAPWPVYPVEPEEDKGGRAKMLVDLGAALTTFDTLGYDFDQKKLVEEFGLTFLGDRVRETRVPAPPTLPGQVDKDGKPVAPAKPSAPPPKPLKPGEKKPKALASGGTAPGFVEGQEYVDQLGTVGTRRAAEGLAAELEQVLALVDSISSYDELSEKLAMLYTELDPERLSEMVERYMVLAQLAGRHAVLEDV